MRFSNGQKTEQTTFGLALRVIVHFAVFETAAVGVYTSLPIRGLGNRCAWMITTRIVALSSSLSLSYSFWLWTPAAQRTQTLTGNGVVLDTKFYYPSITSVFERVCVCERVFSP